MAFIVLYDANVLYPNTLRDLLIRIAQSGTVQAKWTNAILDEMTAALHRNRPDIPAEKIQRLRELMDKAVRDCLVTGYEPLIEGLKLPDPDDRHVLAAAIKPEPRSSSPATSRTSPQPTWNPGTSKQNRRTPSFLTRYTSTCRQWPHPSGRSPTPAPTRPKQSRTS
jgi:PIN domain-containing protein